MKLRVPFYLLLMFALLMSATALSVQAQAPDGESSDADSTSQPVVQPRATLPPAFASSSGCTPPYGPWQTQALLTAPGATGRMYALQNSTAENGSNRVYRLILSDDFGYNWSESPNGLPVPSANVMNIDVDDQNPDTLYVETEMHFSSQKWYGFYQWGGSQWLGRSSELVSNVAISSGESKTIWGTRGSELVRSDDAGRNWQPLAASVGSNGMQLGELYADPHNSGTLYTMGLSEVSHLFRVTPNAQGWEILPKPNNNAPTSMLMDQQSGHLYVTSQTGSATLWRTANAREAAVEQVAWEQVAHFDPTWQNVTLLTASQTNDGLQLFVNATLADGYSRTYRSVGPVSQGIWEVIIFP
ncbi:MAG: hypothetical protein ACPGWR_17685 [Ardenticatenaceae bacterium]